MELLVKKKVSAFREAHGISSNEPIRLKSLLLKLGVQTVFRDISGNISGMAIKAVSDQQSHRFMLINSTQSLGRQHLPFATSSTTSISRRTSSHGAV